MTATHNIGRTERREQVRHWLYRVVLWIIAALLMLGLLACAPGKEDGARRAGAPDSASPVRLILARAIATDSAAVIREIHVDQVLRQLFDSIPGARYLTLNVRDSLSRGADSGLPLAELGRRAGADGAVSVKVTRFGSVLGAEFSVLEPADGRVLFRDLVFQQIRYRDTSGAMLLGPALYDAMSKAVRRFAAIEHARSRPVASSPLVLSAMVIPSDTVLGPMARARDATSRAVLTALNDYAALHFPEIVTFDPLSRDRLYEIGRIAAVANTLPPGAQERRILFDAGVDHFLVGYVERAGMDSLKLRLEIRYVQNRHADSLRFVSEMVQPTAYFASTAFEEDVVVATLDLAEPLYREFAEYVAGEYARSREARSGGAFDESGGQAQ